ncbi:potassium channel family protein [soil metagenome]
MLTTLLSAALLVAITVVVHAFGISLLLRYSTNLNAHALRSAWPIAWILLRLVWWLLLIHLVEIALWALFYQWRGCLPDAETAFYFSGVTYATIGYGDVVLAAPWRMLAPVEGLMGILMCALSAGYLFAVLSHIYQARHQLKPGGAP